MRDIVFEKAQGCAGKVNRTSVYAEVARRVFLKKVSWEISQNSQKKHLCRNFFLDKVRTPSISNFIKNESF